MLLEMKFYSRELKKSTQVNVLLPEGGDGPCKVLWLLHGLTDDHTAWTRYTSIERYANERRLSVVMPCADRSWYTNTAYDVNYFDFITKELPNVCRRTLHGMSEKREDNIVAGLSMGGYGALKMALTHPEQYGHCISLSGALDITRKGRPYNLNEWRSLFGYDIENAEALSESKHDLFALVSKDVAEGRPLPGIYLWCGLNDSLIGVNREFDHHLSCLGVAHTYTESEGDHSWKWWDVHIQSALDYILCK